LHSRHSSPPLVPAFKLPQRATSSSSSSAGLHSGYHVTPSPLAVPSPNWSAVENYLGNNQDNLGVKTPKLLDNNVFDFLTPPPMTPRGAARMAAAAACQQNGRVGSQHDDYSGRDQRLSPRLSPRFPIPEAPTDLSGKANSNGGGNGIGGAHDCKDQNEGAQDLSLKAARTAEASKPEAEPPAVEPPPRPASPVLAHRIKPEMMEIKTEVVNQHDDADGFDFRPSSHSHAAAAAASSSFSSFYLHQQLPNSHAGYGRPPPPNGGYGGRHSPNDYDAHPPPYWPHPPPPLRHGDQHWPPRPDHQRPRSVSPHPAPATGYDSGLPLISVRPHVSLTSSAGAADQRGPDMGDEEVASRKRASGNKASVNGE